MASRYPCLMAAALLFGAALSAVAHADVLCGPIGADAAGQTKSAAVDYLQRAFAERHLPAASAIIIADGKPGFVTFGRDADGRPVSPDTPAYIGSMSKAFTAAAVLQLAERGLVSLDAPVTRYVPEFHPADARGGRITVRQLLNQTSGLSVGADHEWRLPQPGTLRDAVVRLETAHLAAEPGAVFNYHNPNYAVLARLVEVASGQSFAGYLQNHIFAPLGMSHTVTLDRVRETRDGAGRGHGQAFGRYFPVSSPPFFVNGAGGVLTTPRDYAQWMLAQLHEGEGAAHPRVLSAASIRLAQTPGPNAQEYGFGWNRRGARVSHSGGLPNHASYVAVEGCDAIAVFSPVSPATVPLREIALEGLETLKHKQPRPPARDNGVWLDIGIAAAALAALLVAGRNAVLARRWALARWHQPAWRRVASLAPPLVLLAAILGAMPWAVSHVISWSWIWLWFYVPVWVAGLASLALAAAVTLVSRSLALTTRTRG